MTDYSEKFCDLIHKLAHQHAHKDAKKEAFIIKKSISDPLDFDEVEELLQQADEELDFVKYDGHHIWLLQNRALLKHIENHCNYDLWTISCKFDHLEPPSLRNEFDLPSPSI